jgi:hypothetical protein
MRYFLPNFDTSKFNKVFVGNRNRYATATAVCFVDENKILVASFLNKTIYLIQLLENNYQILDKIEIYEYPDLMDYKNGMIITANMPNTNINSSTLSILKLENDKIIFDKNIQLNKIIPHGVRIVDNNNFIITCTNDINRGIFFVNYENGVENKFDDFKYFPKDIFLIGNRLYVSSSSSRPNGLNKVEIKNSILYLFDFPSLNKLDEVEFFGQTDALTIIENTGFITLQGQDSILQFEINQDKLKIIKEITGFDFPHGISSKENIVVVTNYGNNSFDVLSISELIK